MSTPPPYSAQLVTALGLETTAVEGPTTMPQWDRATPQAEVAETCTVPILMWPTLTAPCSTAPRWLNPPTASLGLPCHQKAACSVHHPSTLSRRTRGRKKMVCEWECVNCVNCCVAQRWFVKTSHCITRNYWNYTFATVAVTLGVDNSLIYRSPVDKACFSLIIWYLVLEVSHIWNKHKVRHTILKWN